MALPQFKTGMHSKYMPRHLKADYDRAAQDAELLSMRDRMALLASREMELVRELTKKEAPPWGSAVESLNDLAAAMRSGDTAAFQAAFSAHSAVVRQGADAGAVYETTWHEIRELVQEEAKVAQAEWRRLEALGGVLKADQVWLFVTAVLQSVKSNVSDRKTLAAIQNDINLILAGGRHGIRQDVIESRVVVENAKG